MRRKKILIIIPKKYHLFEFLLPLAFFLSRTYKVSIFSSDKDIRNTLSRANKSQYEKLVSCHYFPALRWGDAFLKNPIIRIVYWCFGWALSFFYTRRYDLVVSPRDDKPLLHMLTSFKKSLVCSPGLGNYEKYYILEELTKNKIKTPNFIKVPNRLCRWIDIFLGGAFINPARRPKEKKFYTVLGNFSQEFLIKEGVSPAHVFLTGNPNYERIVPEKKEDLRKFREKFLFKEDGKKILFFFSQVSFSLYELNQIASCILSIQKTFKECEIILKLHPKFNSRQQKNLDDFLTEKKVRKNVKIIYQIEGGESGNAKLIQISDIVVIEHSNVAFLALKLGVPVLLFNWRKKSDSYLPHSIFFYIKGFSVVESSLSMGAEIKKILKEKNNLLRIQRSSIRDVCILDDGPYNRILKAIKVILKKEE